MIEAACKDMAAEMGQLRRYPITPMGKPRMTRRDAWKKRVCVVRYHAFRDECRLRGVKILDGQTVRFVLPMPKSWSKKKAASLNGAPHRQKPDLDNLLKALWDVLREDSHIASVTASKVWGEAGAIEVSE